MFDDRDSGVDVFDFDELANHLLEQGLDKSPSELHGCLCGLLAAGAPPQPELGLAALGRALELDLHGELAGLAMQLYQVSAAALEDEEFDFHPLLPDDEADLETRTKALAGWCQGFLAGFAQVNQGQVGADASEVLTDIAAIADASVDEDASEDESEGSYMEIVEYLRFAALNAYLDSRPDNPSAGSDPALH